jgi:pSer/pThr/pTyr-binding forkhead associated (FHA) protein
MKISLMVLSAGNSSGKALPINTAQFVIGRDPECNLRPASAMISKRHCAVLVKKGQVFISDFDSTNGTFINDQPIKGEVPIQNGDTLKVGPLSFKMVIEGQPAPSKPTPLPKSKSQSPAQDDDDAAAALLSVDEESGEVTVGTGPTAEESIPGGSTIMEMPAYVPPEEAAAKEAPKPEEKKPAAKKNATGAAQDAAKAILLKMKQGKRK